MHSSCRILAIPLSDIPISTFRACVTLGPNRLLIAIHAIGATFGELINPYRHYQSFTVGCVRRFPIRGHCLVCVFQCRYLPALFLIKDGREGCDGVLHHGNVHPNTRAVFSIALGCASPSSAYLYPSHKFTFSLRSIDSHFCAYILFSPDLNSLTNPQHLVDFI